MLVRLDRFALSKEAAHRLIPVDEERQFVVAKHKTSAEEDAAMRELLWYREELLHRLQATWHEVSTFSS